jgi:hypothetical protein
MKSLRPATFDIASGEFRDFVRRSREVVLLAAITGAITGLGVRFFEFFVLELAFDRVLHGPLWFAAIAPGLGLVASAIILRTIGKGATPATSDEYLRAFHDPEYPLRPRAFIGRIAAAFTTLGMGGAMGLDGFLLLSAALTIEPCWSPALRPVLQQSLRLQQPERSSPSKFRFATRWRAVCCCPPSLHQPLGISYSLR